MSGARPAIIDNSIFDLLESDLKYTIGGFGGKDFTLIAPDGTEYPVRGPIGDISSLMDPITGEIIEGRSIVATCRMRGMTATPERGWKAIVTDSVGKEYRMFVQLNKPDRTVGVFRLTLGLDYSEQPESGGSDGGDA